MRHSEEMIFSVDFLTEGIDFHLDFCNNQLWSDSKIYQSAYLLLNHNSLVGWALEYTDCISAER